MSEIMLYIHDSRAIHHKTTIFEVMIQTAVIQIDGTAGSHTIIGNAHFCMAESGSPFKNVHTVRNQLMIKRAGNTVNHLFIRDSGCDNADIHITFCSQRQSV